MPYISGNTVVDQHTILDSSDAPLTGMTSPADVTLTLLRQVGTTFAAASETVSFTEIGATGRYYFAFAPQNTGRYVLEINETNVNSGLRRVKFTYDILSAGAAFLPSYTNAFCSEADIERWLVQGISSSTRPSDTDAAAWAVTRAAQLMSLCAVLGVTVTPATVTTGSALQALLRDANAVGAALDFTVAQGFGTSPSKTERAEWLDHRWIELVGGRDPQTGEMIPGAIMTEIGGNLVNLATNNILSGDTQAAPVTTPPVDIGITFRMGDVF